MFSPSLPLFLLIILLHLFTPSGYKYNTVLILKWSKWKKKKIKAATSLWPM